ncbi:innexin [Trichonephila inaurata madagascariensis]|uniref:Innexin n=1 Tax=Trichonephila inaurata madagascariensis TaxID=2747483 RepID=A0A8X6WQW8_9ARAC|nr:innexin [Trichonephila inaurata madagascariensis]
MAASRFLLLSAWFYALTCHSCGWALKTFHGIWMVLIRSLISHEFYLYLHYTCTSLMLVSMALCVILGVVFNTLHPLHGAYALGQLLDKCWINSTDSGLKSMSDEVRSRGADVFTVNKSNTQPALYPKVTLFLLCQAASFAVLRFIWHFVKKDYVYNIINFIESSVSKKLHEEINNTFVIKMLIKKFGKRRKCFALLKLAEIISILNVLVQFCLTNFYFEEQIFSNPITLSVTFNSNWTAKCDYTIKLRQISKCIFRYRDSSTDFQSYNASCSFTTYSIYQSLEKILCIYFLVLATVTAMKIIWNILIFLFPDLRFWSTFKRREEELGPIVRYLKAIINQCSVEDWFLLDLLCTNLYSLDLEPVVKEFALKLHDKRLICLNENSISWIHDPEKLGVIKRNTRLGSSKHKNI